MKPSFKNSLIFLSFCLIFWLRPVWADLQVPASPQGYVSDYAQLISPSERQALEARLKNFEETNSTQIFVAIFPSLEGENLEDFSIRLAEKWKVGQKAKDNGVILLIFKNDRKLRIEVGYGLEAVITDALTQSIINREITPYFKQGLFAAGISSGLNALFKAVQGEYEAMPPPPKTSKDDFDWGFLLFLLIFFIIPPFFRRGRGGLTFSSGGWGGGGGGFSGGGGGSFGGGGSSGSW